MPKKVTLEDAQKLAESRGGKCLSEEYVNNKTKMLWECDKGHKWFAKYNNIQQGDWCPVCYGEGRYRAQQKIKEAKELAILRGGECLSVARDYVDLKSKLLWKCSEGHEWGSTYKNIKCGRWCPLCAVKRRTNKRRYSIKCCEKLAEKHGGKCLSKEYTNSKNKYVWMCSKDHVWMATYGDVQQGHWCPYCAGTAKLTLKHCHDLAKKRSGKFLSKEYINVDTKYLWGCEKGHQWYASYQSVKKTWCPYCSSNLEKTIFDAQILARKNNGECLSDVYCNCMEKLTWRCDKGHIWNTSYNCIQSGSWCPVCAVEKRKNTMLKRYGVEHPAQVKRFALKAAKSANNSYILYHWFTGEELICQGSYEKAVVEYLNLHMIDFKWQPEVFKMPGGKTYRPDLYLIDERKWVEIKGYFRKDAWEKWNWFSKKHPNSELWDKKQLKKMNIL